MDKATKRMASEIKRFRDDPPPFVRKLYVDELNSHLLFFLIDGPVETPFESGEYVMQMNLPPEYPFKAPQLKFLTPNGRFTVNKSVCIAGVSAHHESEWSCQQNIMTMLIGVISFMTEDIHSHVGAERTTRAEKRRLAENSKDYNVRHGYAKMFE